MYFQRMRDLREDADKTQKQIADLLLLDKEVYRRYEVGLRDIPVACLLSLADYYEVNLDYLVGRTNESKMLPKPKDYQKLVETTLREEKKGNGFTVS